jgi:hypothetical protein
MSAKRASITALWSYSSTSARDLDGATTRTVSPRRNFGGKLTFMVPDSNRLPPMRRLRGVDRC